MAKSLIEYSQRVIFPKGKQVAFLLKVKDKTNLSWSLLAKKTNIHIRTLNDLKREEYSISLSNLKKMCEISKLEMPLEITIKDPFWYASKGAKIGALAALKKYGRVGGNPEYRKKRWRKWWNEKGKYQHNGCLIEPLLIRNPRFSKNLAEFTGIMLGDGGMTSGQVIISTNSVDDREYGHFVKELIKKLFRVEAAIYYRPNILVMTIVVSRKKLVEFCSKKLGLKIGNKLKQGLDIPSWIRENPEFEKRCIRGLMDTDGCIFNEIHKIRGKLYNYKRLSLVSVSPMLRQSVFDILNNFKLNPKIRSNRCVQIEDKEKIKEYFKIIGSSNQKHLKKYYN